MNTGGFIQASSHLRTLTTGEFTESLDLTSPSPGQARPGNTNHAEKFNYSWSFSLSLSLSLSHLLDTGAWHPAGPDLRQCLYPVIPAGSDEIS